MMSDPRDGLAITLTGIDGSPIYLKLTFDTAPFYTFMIHEWDVQTKTWIGGPSFGNWDGFQKQALVDEINAMGIVEWIKEHLIFWFEKVMEGVYGSRVKRPVSTPKPLPTEPLTMGNIAARLNPVLFTFVAIDKDGDGLPELYSP